MEIKKIKMIIKFSVETMPANLSLDQSKMRALKIFRSTLDALK